MIRIPRWSTRAGGLAFGAILLAAAPAFAASTGSSNSMTFEATAYGPSLQDNYPYGAVDYFGQPLTQGDIAVDPSVIPLHSCVRVTGYTSPNLPAGGFIGEADDEGGAIIGKHIDIFMNASPAQVSNFGIQSVQVTVLGQATNMSLSGTAACAAYATGNSSSTSQSTGSGSSGTPGTGGSSSSGAQGTGNSSPGTQNTSGGGTSSGSSGSNGAPSQGSGTTPGANGGQTASNPSISSFDAAVVKLAWAEVGRPYVWGGTSPAGFDCSGLVQWIFAHDGVNLPRLSSQQYRAGTPVSRANLRPGDLVFFSTYKPGPSHVGIYIGAANGYQHAFIAADNPSVGVEVDNLDSAKWVNWYYGASRISPPNSGSAGTSTASTGSSSSQSTSGSTAANGSGTTSTPTTQNGHHYWHHWRWWTGRHDGGRH